MFNAPCSPPDWDTVWECDVRAHCQGRNVQADPDWHWRGERIFSSLRLIICCWSDTRLHYPALTDRVIGQRLTSFLHFSKEKISKMKQEASVFDSKSPRQDTVLYPTILFITAGFSNVLAWDKSKIFGERQASVCCCLFRWEATYSVSY